MELKKSFFTTADLDILSLYGNVQKMRSSDMNFEIATSQNFILEYFFKSLEIITLDNKQWLWGRKKIQLPESLSMFRPKAFFAL